jgi:hypothetical protein
MLLGRDVVPTAAWRGALVTRLRAMGYTATALSNVIRASMTRQAIAEALIALQRKAT